MPLLYLAIAKGHNTQGLNACTAVLNNHYTCWHDAKSSAPCMYVNDYILCVSISSRVFISSLASLTLLFNQQWGHVWGPSSTRACMGCHLLISTEQLGWCLESILHQVHHVLSSTLYHGTTCLWVSSMPLILCRRVGAVNKERLLMKKKKWKLWFSFESKSKEMISKWSLFEYWLS